MQMMSMASSFVRLLQYSDLHSSPCKRSAGISLVSSSAYDAGVAAAVRSGVSVEDEPSEEWGSVGSCSGEICGGLASY